MLLRKLRPLTCADTFDEIFSTPRFQTARLLDRVSDAPDSSAPINIMTSMVRILYLSAVSQEQLAPQRQSCMHASELAWKGKTLKVHDW